MNWPSARSIRASGPRRMVNRAPAIFAAVAKSIMPSASPSSKCCFGANSELARLAMLCQHDVGVSRPRRPARRASRMLGKPSSMRLISPSRGQRRAFPAPPSRPRNVVASASSAAVSAPASLALTDLLRQRVAPRLLLLQRGLRGRAVRRPDASSSADTGGRPAPRHRGVEAGGIGSDGADVVHRSGLHRFRSRPSWRQ